jgi:hypothetical protein
MYPTLLGNTIAGLGDVAPGKSFRAMLATSDQTMLQRVGIDDKADVCLDFGKSLQFTTAAKNILTDKVIGNARDENGDQPLSANTGVSCWTGKISCCIVV